MGAYDGAEVCEIVGLLLLNNLANKFDKNSVSLFRDDGLPAFKNINGHRADKIRKGFHQLPEAGARRFLEKGVLRNFVKFTRKHLCQGLTFNKVAGHLRRKTDCL